MANEKSKESLKNLKLIEAVYSDSESKQIIRIPLNIVILMFILSYLYLFIKIVAKRFLSRYKERFLIVTIIS